MRVLPAMMIAASIVARAEAQEADAESSVQRVVDVRSLVLQQIAEAGQQGTGLATENRVAVVPVEFLALGISALVSLSSTIVLLLIVFRKRPIPPQRVAPPPVRVAPVTQHNAVDALLRQAHLILLEKRSSYASKPSAVQVAAEPHLGVARAFGRGRGELALAQKLATGQEQYPWEKRMRDVESSLHENGSVATARKFGVGMGELQLAHALRAFQAQQERSGS